MLDLLNSLGVVIWDFDPTFFSFGPITVRYYGILFALALAVGYMTIRWRYKEEGEDPEKASNFAFAIIIAIIVGTRLFHCFFYDWDFYSQHPFEIIKFWKGGLASHGAAFGIMATCICYDYFWRKVPVRISVDRLAYCIPFAMICVRLGNFLNSEIVGAPCDPESPLAFIFTRVDGVPRYPSQLFEVGMGIIAGIVMFGTYYYYKKVRKTQMPLGMPTSLILVLYFAMRFCVEYFKEYQVAERIGGLREGQILSIPFLAIGLIGLAISLFGPWRKQFAIDYLGNHQIKSDSAKETTEEDDEREAEETIEKAKEETKIARKEAKEAKKAKEEAKKAKEEAIKAKEETKKAKEELDEVEELSMEQLEELYKKYKQ